MADELHVTTEFLPDDHADRRYLWYDPLVPANWAADNKDDPPHAYRSLFGVVALKYLSSVGPECLKPGTTDGRVKTVADAMRRAAHVALESLLTDEAKGQLKKEQEAHYASIWDEVLGIGPRPGPPAANREDAKAVMGTSPEEFAGAEPAVPSDGLFVAGLLHGVASLKPMAPFRMYCCASRSEGPPRRACDPVHVGRAAARHFAEMGLISPAAIDRVYEIRNHPLLDAMDRPVPDDDRADRAALIGSIRLCLEHLGRAFLVPEGNGWDWRREEQSSKKSPPEWLLPLHPEAVAALRDAGSAEVEAFRYFGRRIRRDAVVWFRRSEGKSIDRAIEEGFTSLARTFDSRTFFAFDPGQSTAPEPAGEAPESPPDGPEQETWRDRPPLL